MWLVAQDLGFEIEGIYWMTINCVLLYLVLQRFYVLENIVVGSHCNSTISLLALCLLVGLGFSMYPVF